MAFILLVLFAMAGFQNCHNSISIEYSGNQAQESDGTSNIDSAGSQGGTGTLATSSGGLTVSSNGGTLVTRSATITTTHRFAPTAFGGWGPHLGHLLRTAKGELWFVDDTGNDVNKNAGAAYLKWNGISWAAAGFQTFPGTVQQNTASVAAGNLLFTYGVDVQFNRIVECYFSTEQPLYACNHLAFDIGSSQNYIGATISRSGTKVVWWTGNGTFSYIYNYGGGWNGPIVSTVGGYAGFSYVYARIAEDNSQFELVGAAPKGSGGASVGYAGGYGSTALGLPITNWTVLEVTGSGLETWIDPQGGTHIITYGSNEPKIFYKPKGGALSFHSSLGVSGVVGARLVESPSQLFLVLAMADGRLIYKNAPRGSGPLAWSQMENREIALPASLGVLSIYPESPMYQTTASTGFNIAINGQNNQGTVVHIYDPR